MSVDFSKFPPIDKDWSEKEWQILIEYLIQNGIVTYAQVAALLLGHINPPQVGTSIASNKSFQKHFPKRQTWINVREWFNNQSGICADCGTRLELQADHVIPRQEKGDDADRLENMTLRCRRCNVVRRPSHKKGGLTFLSSESALMWILFVKKPATYDEFKKLCREYGLTMADIRFQESWAMALWLNKSGSYKITSPEEEFISDEEIPAQDENTVFPEDSLPE